MSKPEVDVKRSSNLKASNGSKILQTDDENAASADDLRDMDVDNMQLAENEIEEESKSSSSEIQKSRSSSN